jgi:hypothetical protein
MARHYYSSAAKLIDSNPIQCSPDIDTLPTALECCLKGSAGIDHPSISAVIFAHLRGQDSGAAPVDIMCGGQSPSGRLPYTDAKMSPIIASCSMPSILIIHLLSPTN